MKKIITLVLAMLMCVACVAFTACGGKQQISLVNVDLSSEEYAFAVKKGDTALKTSVNEFFVAKNTANIFLAV